MDNAVFLAALAVNVENAGVGLLPWLGLRQPWRTAVGVILLDYTLWHGHRWNHLVPVLWRFHAVHHSGRDLDVTTGPRCRNWSSLVNLWDRLHGTLRLDMPQDAITIGVPTYDRPEAVTIGRMLFEPFRRQPDYWRGRLTREAGPP